MQRKYWLSYDLGVGGDYKGLYQWLDDHNAEPCGNSVAFFTYDIPNEQEGDNALKNDLLESVKTIPGNQLYIIRRKGDGKTVGSFIYGKRRSAPWVGYGNQTDPIDDE